MPNWCTYSMRVKGSAEDKKKFLDLFLVDDSNVNQKKQRYFARTWVFEDCNEYDLTDDGILAISGQCAWSVQSCMFNGYPQENPDTCPTLEKISEELNLEIEVASDEQGMCFVEYYHLKNGKIIIEDCYNVETPEWKENMTNEEENLYFEEVDKAYSWIYERFTY